MTALAAICSPDDVMRDAFAHMACWADNLGGPKTTPKSLRAKDLVGWCDHPDPFARIIQAALGIRLALEKIAVEDFLSARAYRDYLRQRRMRLRRNDLIKATWLTVDVDDFEDTDRRCRYQPRRLITADDEIAALLVVHHANRVLLTEIARKKRWRAMSGDTYIADWDIVKRVLVGHQSLRDIGRDLDLDKTGNGLGRRFRGAVKAVAGALGDAATDIAGQLATSALSPQPNPYYRAPHNRIGEPPEWHHKLWVHGDRPDLSRENELVEQFLVGGGAVQKLPHGLAGDFQGEVTEVKHCTCYGPDGELLWTVSSRPAPAWDNVEGVARYPDADLVGMPPWEGKMHEAFAVKYRRGLQWLPLWQSKKTERFAVTFYNHGEDRLQPGKHNGDDGGVRDCTGPAWEYEGPRVEMRDAPDQLQVYVPGRDGLLPRQRRDLGVEPGEVKNDSYDLTRRWTPPPSYYNDGMNAPDPY